jgi:hypothetical protein
VVHINRSSVANSHSPRGFLFLFKGNIVCWNESRG